MVGASAQGTLPAANNQTNDGAMANDSNQNLITGERRDTGVHGFWERGRPCVFNVRITDTDTQSYHNKDVSKVLEAQEKEKKDKYL